MLEKIKARFRGTRLQRKYWDMLNALRKLRRRLKRLLKKLRRWLKKLRRRLKRWFKKLRRGFKKRRRRFKKLRLKWKRDFDDFNEKTRDNARKFIRQRIIMPAVYNLNRHKPIDPEKVLFIDVRHPELSDSMRVLYDRLEKYGYTLQIHLLGNYMVSRRDYVRNCKSMLKDLATAKYAFIDDASRIVSCINKRPETIIVNTWHACGAFKKFGFATVDKKFGADAEELKKYPNYGNLNLVTVSSPEVVRAYEESMGLEGMGIVQPLGISRTDVFYSEKRISEAYSRLHSVFPETEGKKIILYSPTFRGRVSRAKAPNRLDIERFYRAFGEDYVLLIKHHPYVKKLPALPDGLENRFVFQATGKLEIEDLLITADILITDYSSVVFEYSLMERPVLFYAYDLDNYEGWRGFYYPYEEMTPGPVCKTTEELIDSINDIKKSFDPSAIHAFRQKFMSSCDGHSTDRILAAIGIEDPQRDPEAQPAEPV